MNKNTEKLKLLAENSALDDCGMPIIISDEDFAVCFANKKAREMTGRFNVGGSMLTLLPFAEVFGRLTEAETRCMVCTLTECEEYSSVIVVTGVVKKIRYFAFVLRSYPVLPPDELPWYIKSNYSYLAQSMDKILSRVHKTANSIIRYEAQLTRLCTYVLGRYVNMPHDTDIGDMLRDIIGAVRPMLSTLGVSTDISYDDSVGTMIDGPAAPAGDLMLAMVLAVILYSETGRIKIERSFIRETEQIEFSVRSRVSRRIREQVKVFDDILDVAEPIYIELAAIKDLSEANGAEIDLKFDNDEMVLCYRTAGKLVGGITFKSADAAKNITDHFNSLSAALFDLVKLSISKKEI